MVSTYTLHSEQIQQVNKAELYLCVELYYDLTWSKHISNITTKVKKNQPLPLPIATPAIVLTKKKTNVTRH